METPGKSKGPAKGRKRLGSGRGPAKAPSKKASARPKGDGSRTSKSWLPPSLTVLLLASVLLAGLIYWGRGAKAPSTQAVERPKSTLPNSQAPKTPIQKTADPAASKPSAPATGGPTHVPPSNGKKPIPQNAPPPPAGAGPSPSAPQPESPKLSLALNAPVSGPHGPAPHPPQPPGPPLTAPVARVAIVIDDFGMDLDMAKRFLALPFPVTFSILPYQRHSREIAELAHARHHEVMLHLPMEPHGFPQIDPGTGALLLSMSHDAMERSVRTAMDATPYLSGVNNHMGSRFTEDAAAMKVVLSELHRRGAYFIDSRTTPKSVGHLLAQQVQVSSRWRDVFLDHNPTEASVRSQVMRLIRIAKIQGSALGIGHPHEATLNALTQLSDLFRQEGIAVVPAGALVRDTLSQPWKP